MSALKDSVRKRSVDSKTGKISETEVDLPFEAVPPEKLAYVCPECGFEKPIKKAGLYSLVQCPNGCKSLVTVQVIKNLASDRYSHDLRNLQLREKMKWRRLK